MFQIYKIYYGHILRFFTVLINSHLAGTEIVTEADHDGPAPETVIGTGLEVGTAEDQGHGTGDPGQGHGTGTETETGREAGAGPGTETEKEVEVGLGTETGTETEKGTEKETGTGKGPRKVALRPLPR